MQQFYGNTGEGEAVGRDEKVMEAFDSYAAAVHSGEIRGGQLHMGMYNTTAEHLIGAMLQTFAPQGEQAYSAPSNWLSDYVQQNIFAFSAAKTLTQYEEMSRKLLDESGAIRSWEQYRAEVEGMGLRYNYAYLKTEYEAAVAECQMAEKWQDFQAGKEAAGQLEYRTAGDEHVRDEHAQLDGLVAGIDDPVWNTIYPPNDWGCRCTVVQVDNPAAVWPQNELNARTKEARVPKYFKHNAGKSGMVYNQGHPYFKALPKQLSAEEHYGMPSPEAIYRHPARLTERPNAIGSIEELKAWWADRVSREGDAQANAFFLPLPALNNLVATLDNELLQKALTAYAQDGRFTLLPNIPQAIQQPDEVWTVKRGKKKGRTELLTAYIKYYNNKPMVVLTRTVQGEGEIRVVSVHNAELNRLADWRKGILRYKKPLK